MGTKIGASTVGAWLNNENPVFKYGFAILIVFIPLYIAQSYGLSIGWPIALLIALGIFVFSDFWKGWFTV